MTIVQERKVTRFYAVPPIVLALAKHPLVEQFDLSSLKQVFSGAAPLGAELAAEAAQRVGCEVVQGYGMTELSPVSHCTAVGDFRPGTSGITVPNTECRLVDPETGEDQDVGGEGELWVRGPQVMKGYLNNDDATAHTIDDDGWLHTGDVAVIDEHAHVSIVDRVKELIKYKGFQVPPAELEALLDRPPEDRRRRRHRRPRRRGRGAAQGVHRGATRLRADRGGGQGARRRAPRQLQAHSDRRVHRRDPEVGRAARSCAVSSATADDRQGLGRGKTACFTAGWSPISRRVRRRSTSARSVSGWQVGHQVIERRHGVSRSLW